MIQGLLREHGIASMLKRGPGFDVPEFLAGGPRQVFVLESVAEAAREVLEGTPRRRLAPRASRRSGLAIARR